MKTNFHKSLAIALEQIGKPEWAEPLIELEQRFHLIPKDDIAFSTELLEVLWSLQDALKTDANLPLKQVFAIRFAKLDAWTFRFRKTTDASKDYLNPLAAVPADFSRAEVSQSGTAFPAEDIIKRWVRDHLA